MLIAYQNIHNIYLFKHDSITVNYNFLKIKGDRGVITSKILVNQRAQQSILVENLTSQLQNGETV